MACNNNSANHKQQQHEQQRPLQAGQQKQQQQPAAAACDEFLMNEMHTAKVFSKLLKIYKKPLKFRNENCLLPLLFNHF